MTKIVTLDCAECGQAFRPQRDTQRYCTRSCAGRATARTRSAERNSNWRGGKTAHPLYDTYMDMVGRCHRPTHARYQDYGGRGIQVCARWRDDFWAFVADMGERPSGCSLDRIDNDRGYGPENCRWATPTEQRHNRREQRKPTACRQGHEYTPENTRITPAGAQACRTCAREYARQARERRKAATAKGDV